MFRRLLALTFLAGLLALPCPAENPCREDACSNDRDGILGDEELAWTASEGATKYEISVADQVCATVIGSTSYLVSGTPCDEANDGSGFRVRACNDAGCSEWSRDVVEILPYACLRATDWNDCHSTDSDGNCVGGHDTQCEEECYDGAPRRLGSRWEECP